MASGPLAKSVKRELCAHGLRWKAPQLVYGAGLTGQDVTRASGPELSFSSATYSWVGEDVMPGSGGSPDNP